MRIASEIQDGTRPLADSTLGGELDRQAVAALAPSSGGSRQDRLARILADQRSRWHHGSPAPTERYLELLPEFADDPQARLALVENEIRARQETGQDSTLADFLRRFPDLQTEIASLFERIGHAQPPAGAGPLSSDAPTAPYGIEYPGEVVSERTFPQLIDRYQILRLAGQGGFGKVFVARDEMLGRLVAIKVPRLDRVRLEENVDTFLREARILAELDHAHIVPVYDVGRTPEGVCYVVSKLIDGESLTGRIADFHAAFGRIAELTAAVAEALDHAHKKGLVHRDVKPGNILIDAANKPYLADFGLAMREEDFLSVEQLAGTPAYMSPEQVRGEGHRVDGRSDIFSLGIILYELIAGAHPFGHGTPAELMRRIAYDEPPPPRRLDPTIPPELERICLRALAPRASDRYETAGDMAAELRLFAGAPRARAPEGAVAEESREAPRAVSDPARGEPPDRSRVPRVIPRGLRSFGADDADFFLDLLHGPRDRDGLPESVGFWKSRIEASESFAVGLIYGPSGCGKSSLVRAGLLPRLSPRVVSIYEPASADLETRLLARVRKACPGIDPGATLAEALAEVRRGAVLPGGKKLLIVIDQFEQWLHARLGGPESEMVRALRQCDGERVTALLLVRVEFWMACSRLMRQVEVRVVEGENAAVVDLFPPAHARKVLSALGVAYGALPPPPAAPTADQEAFVDRAVELITQDEAVMPVRLALLAELEKGRPWTTRALANLGGAVGIGVRFLDEAFLSDSAPPERRSHLDAARRVLAALLPATGGDIKGNVRSYDALIDAAGYRGDPGRFESLLHILDIETRLLTPIAAQEEGDPPAAGPDPSQADPPPGRRFYQLTHDYLVPPVREWLARQQKETARGRAELDLADRASLWAAKPERKQLPTLLEWASIRMLTDSTRWNERERAMMKVASRHHLLSAGRVLASAAAIGLLALLAAAAYDDDRNRTQAHALVSRLLDAESVKVPAVIAEMAPFRRWTDQTLRHAVGHPAIRPSARVHARIALLPVDPAQAPGLVDALLEADPDEFLIIRDALLPRAKDVIPALRHVADSHALPARSTFRAAVALARFEPDDPRWADRAGPVVQWLVEQPALLVPAWVELLRPIRGPLVPALDKRLRDRPEDEPLVASILADYAHDQPELLAEAVADAAPEEFAVLLSSRWKDEPRAVTALEAALARRRAEYPGAEPDHAASRVASAAIALMRAGRTGPVWPLLAGGPDPRIRSSLIDRMGPRGCDASPLIERLLEEREPSIRAAILLALGRFHSPQLRDASRTELIRFVLDLYRDDPDPAIHAASGWLLGKWGQADAAHQALEPLATGKIEGSRRWYLNRHAMTMILLPGAEAFTLGSPDDEPWRRDVEGRRVVRVPSVDMAATEVTVSQFREFLKSRLDLHDRFARFAAADPQLPQIKVSWYEAAAFCNWLSQEEGLPPDQWCYEPNAEGKYDEGMRVVPDFLKRRGYRLPLEAEWEHACRAGTTTSRSYGDSLELLGRYAWSQDNSSDHAMPVASLLPNDFGLFDMHGNVFEWCQDLYGTQDGPDPSPPAEDILSNAKNRHVRGGGFMSHAHHVRSANRNMDFPYLHNETGGFRVVRSRPESNGH